jgi:hypothetical protein
MAKRQRSDSSSSRSHSQIFRLTLIVQRDDTATYSRMLLAYSISAPFRHRRSTTSIRRIPPNHSQIIFQVQTSPTAISEPTSDISSPSNMNHCNTFRSSTELEKERNYRRCIANGGHQYGMMFNVPQNIPVPWLCGKCGQELVSVRQCKRCRHNLCVRCFEHSPNRTGGAADLSKVC